MNVLHFAAACGCVGTVLYLAPKMESMLHNTTTDGCTMLHLAARSGNAEVMELLINKYKLSLTAQDKVRLMMLQRLMLRYT